MNYREVIEHPEQFDFTIDSLGQGSLDNPLSNRRFTEEKERILFPSQEQQVRDLLDRGHSLPSFEKAGPRQKLFHDPHHSRAAIVTCGGLCPGINDVIKALVRVLHHDYGVENVYGIRYGYRGLSRRHQQSVILDPARVDNIHEQGGTILGSSRGSQDIGEMVETLQDMNVNLLFTIGGDGTLRGAGAIAAEARRRGLPLSVVGIPKTIDNDLSFTDRTFGFETAVYAAEGFITTAHNEANGALNGVGLVKLMGRDSGFIAAYASLANTVVDFCLIPEVDFQLEGEHGLLKALERRFASGREHGVVVVAEGAGQPLFEGLEVQRDASGNVLKHDIGELLKGRIESHFKGLHQEITVKYFDPSYYIRSVAARGADAIFCYQLAENAVHAALAGRTNMVVGHWNNEYVHIPIALATLARRTVDPNGALWQAVLGMTRQEDYFRGTH